MTKKRNTMIAILLIAAVLFAGLAIWYKEKGIIGDEITEDDIISAVETVEKEIKEAEDMIVEIKKLLPITKDPEEKEKLEWEIKYNLSQIAIGRALRGERKYYAESVDAVHWRIGNMKETIERAKADTDLEGWARKFVIAFSEAEIEVLEIRLSIIKKMYKSPKPTTWVG